MPPALTLERRVTLWSALVVALSLFICCGGGAWFLYVRAVAQLDAELAQVAEQFFEQKRLHGGVGFDLRNQHEIAEWLPSPNAEIAVEVEQGGVVYFRSPRLTGNPLPSDGNHFRFVRLAEGHMRLGAIHEAGVIVRIVAPARAPRELLRNLTIVVALGLPFMIALVVLGGRSIARQALEPVGRIADSAEQINSRELSRRVPVPEPPDEIRRLALVLNATLDRLETSFLQAERFSADASHELKTPLTAIHADLEALLGSPSLGERDRAAVAETLETTKRLAAITTSLLLLARADAGRLQLDLRPVDFVDLVQDCLEDTRIIAEAAAIDVRIEFPTSAQVRGEPTRLRQIVSNLLSNAVKYNAKGGYIRIALRAQQSRWVLEVANTGHGIPSEHAPHIFDRFFRTEHHAAVSGHGLGLAISRELARAHDGTLELVRADRQETVFQLTLNATPSR